MKNHDWVKRVRGLLSEAQPQPGSEKPSLSRQAEEGGARVSGQGVAVNGHGNSVVYMHGHTGAGERWLPFYQRLIVLLAAAVPLAWLMASVYTQWLTLYWVAPGVVRLWRALDTATTNEQAVAAILASGAIAVALLGWFRWRNRHR